LAGRIESRQDARALAPSGNRMQLASGATTPDANCSLDPARRV
jgi:hypothetical protein